MKSAQEYKLPVIDLGIVSPNVKISKHEQKKIETYWKEQDAKAKQLREAVKKATTKEERREARAKLNNFQVETYQNAPQLEFSIDEFELNKVSQEVAKDYVYNMNFWIKKWEAKSIIEMRKKIADMVQEGEQVSTIRDYILTVPEMKKLFEVK